MRVGWGERGKRGRGGRGGEREMWNAVQRDMLLSTPPAQVGRDVERLQLCAAITESPESCWCGRKLITGVGEVPQQRTVDTGQPQQPAEVEGGEDVSVESVSRPTSQ